MSASKQRPELLLCVVALVVASTPIVACSSSRAANGVSSTWVVEVCDSTRRYLDRFLNTVVGLFSAFADEEQFESISFEGLYAEITDSSEDLLAEYQAVRLRVPEEDWALFEVFLDIGQAMTSFGNVGLDSSEAVENAEVVGDVSDQHRFLSQLNGSMAAIGRLESLPEVVNSDDAYAEVRSATRTLLIERCVLPELDPTPIAESIQSDEFLGWLREPAESEAGDAQWSVELATSIDLGGDGFADIAIRVGDLAGSGWSVVAESGGAGEGPTITELATVMFGVCLAMAESSGLEPLGSEQTPLRWRGDTITHDSFPGGSATLVVEEFSSTAAAASVIADVGSGLELCSRSGALSYSQPEAAGALRWEQRSVDADAVTAGVGAIQWFQDGPFVALLLIDAAGIASPALGPLTHLLATRIEHVANEGSSE